MYEPQNKITVTSGLNRSRQFLKIQKQFCGNYNVTDRIVVQHIWESDRLSIPTYILLKRCGNWWNYFVTDLIRRTSHFIELFIEISEISLKFSEIILYSGDSKRTAFPRQLRIYKNIIEVFTR